MQVNSAILGNVDVNAPRQITQDEINAYAKFCRQHGIINDGSTDGIENAHFVQNYFVNTWNAEITEQNLRFAWEKIRSYLKLYSPAAIEYFKVADQEPDRANALANWLATQGGPGQLVKEVPEAYQNLRLLLIELRGREINRKTISEAEGRISYRAGRQLHYVPLPRQQNPRQHQADPNQKTGQFIGQNDMVKTPDGGLRSKTHAEQAADRRARDEAQPTERQHLSVEEKTFRHLANELLRFGTHGQQATIKQTYDKLVHAGAMWQRVYMECQRVVDMYKKSSQISGWGGR